MGLSPFPWNYSRPTFQTDSFQRTFECEYFGMFLRRLLNGGSFSFLPAGKLSGVVYRLCEHLMRLHDVPHEAWIHDNIVQRLPEILHAILVRQR